MKGWTTDYFQHHYEPAQFLSGEQDELQKSQRLNMLLKCKSKRIESHVLFSILLHIYSNSTVSLQFWVKSAQDEAMVKGADHEEPRVRS